MNQEQKNNIYIMNQEQKNKNNNRKIALVVICIVTFSSFLYLLYCSMNKKCTGKLPGYIEGLFIICIISIIVLLTIKRK